MTNTHVILVRHGETTANHEQRWYGAMDAPLTERGWLQVKATGEHFARRHSAAPVDAIYVSPLLRARNTAAAISAALGMEAVVDEGLREFSIGDWEGRTYQDLIDHEQLWARWAKDPSFTPPNGESPLSFGKRAEAAVQALAEAHPNQRIVLVTHGGIISCLLAVWLGNNSGDWIRWAPHNCAVSELYWDGERWCGEVVNDISHLPPDGVIEVIPSYAPEMKKSQPD